MLTKEPPRSSTDSAGNKAEESLNTLGDSSDLHIYDEVNDNEIGF